MLLWCSSLRETDSTGYWIAGVPPALSAKRETIVVLGLCGCGAVRARRPRSQYHVRAKIKLNYDREPFPEIRVT